MKTRGPWALSSCLWCITTCPDIQLSFMLYGHVAEVKSILLLRCKLFIFNCFTARSKPQNDLEHWKVKGFLSFYPRAYFRSIDRGVRDTGRFSKLPYLGMKRGHWPKFQKFHMYCTSFYPSASKLRLFLFYGQRFQRYGSIFQNCNIWAWNVAIGQSARSCTYTLFLPQGSRNWG